MTHLKKYWLWYLIAIVVVVVVILAYSNWETVKGWFSGNDQQGGGVPGDGTRMGNLNLSRIPASYLSQLTENEKNIISNFFSKVNGMRGIVTQADIDQINSELSQIGSTTNFIKNDSTSKAKCKEGEDCWTLNLIIFTMCRCRKYASS